MDVKLFSINNREFKKRRFLATHVNRKWTFRTLVNCRLTCVSQKRRCQSGCVKWNNESHHRHIHHHYYHHYHHHRYHYFFLSFTQLRSG